MLKVTVAQIVESLGGELRGEPAKEVTSIQSLADAGPNDISFISHVRYQSQLSSTQAGCLIVSPELADAASARGVSIVTPEPYLYYAKLSQWWRQQLSGEPLKGRHPSACVDPKARVAPDAWVGPFAVIEAGAEVQSGAQVGAHAFVGQGAVIGANSLLHARVTVHRGCSLGARCIVHSGAVIGADGFGFAPSQGRWEKIEQLGAVRIADDCEIGANTCIDRGALADTVLACGVKLDNLVQVGHNVQIGEHSALAGCAGVAGSAVIGAHCTVGGGAVVLGHLSVVDHVHVSAASVVTRSIKQPGQYSGFFPIDENARWEKNAATIKQLHQIRERLRALEGQLSRYNNYESPNDEHP